MNKLNYKKSNTRNENHCKDEINLETMTYEEFKSYCHDRACDGRWSMVEAIACMKVIEEIDSIKIKGLFKKKRTLEARELEWRRRKYKSIS